MILIIKEEKEVLNSQIISIIEKAKIVCPDLYDRFNNHDNLSALDLGSSFPLPLFCLYNNFNFNRFVAVDQNNETDCIKYFIKNYPEDATFAKNAINFFDLYSVCFVQTEGEKPMITNREEFDQMFTKNFHLGTDLKTFFKKSTELFDFINASNILHFFPNEMELKYLFGEIARRLSHRGIIYIRVQQKPHFNYYFFRNLLQDFFSSGTLFEVWNSNSFQSARFINVSVPLNP